MIDLVLVLYLLMLEPREVLKMNLSNRTQEPQAGKVGWILLWALGIPLPVLLILFLMRGCT